MEIVNGLVDETKVCGIMKAVNTLNVVYYIPCLREFIPCLRILYTLRFGIMHSPGDDIPE